jgi:hypothetical protein
MSQYDLPGLYQFLANTPEQGLRKMLVDQKPMTETHFNLLMKVMRSGDEVNFCGLADKKEFPKIKLGPSEQKLKDKFWDECFKTFETRGLLNPALPTKAAA